MAPSSNRLWFEVFVVLLKNIVALEVMLLSCLTFTPLLIHALLAVTVVHYSLRTSASPFIPFYSLLKYLFVHSL